MPLGVGKVKMRDLEILPDFTLLSKGVSEFHKRMSNYL